jgi:hypothetical protein
MTRAIDPHGAVARVRNVDVVPRCSGGCGRGVAFSGGGGVDGHVAAAVGVTVAGSRGRAGGGKVGVGVGRVGGNGDAGGGAGGFAKGFGG